VGEYTIPGFLFYRTLAANGRRFQLKYAFLAVIFTVSFGGFDEWRQTFIPGRSGRLLEVGIDAIGAGLGQVIVLTVPTASFDRLKRDGVA
jgi:VanZ family protein